MSVHPLGGHFSVEASAKLIRHYRYAEERLMRILGGWIALTPELPAKLLFGRHVWDCAQHADLWGRRLPELRSAAQQSEPPNDKFVAFMELLEGLELPSQTPERLASVYRVLKPHLLAAYEAHLSRANAVYEPPTRRILERCVDEERRHIVAGAMVLSRLIRDQRDREAVEGWERRLRAALGEAGGVTGDMDAADLADRPRAGVMIEGGERTTTAAGGRTERDVIALESSFDAGVLEPDLVAAVAAHGRALAQQDLRGAKELLALPAVSAVRGWWVWRRLGATDSSSWPSSGPPAPQSWSFSGDVPRRAGAFLPRRLSVPRAAPRAAAQDPRGALNA